ncbi:hypothetical protein ABB37_01729 [Leptomonas pyrrhocoris]|uniref:REH2 DRSM domain-containing protein n=1 Tax=Leptomonas pyrrhocoris TaxID=157538 RepID=A0A0N0DZN9_LEPPY|nr:hypothetical protein ABB37_01729 [Leptomonas pyrrhocoris]XP_015663861.1 hypothetical protein ABB37_01729 [Leptomonas pyrrhocoris]KPA85421.1 hypothetical protein ABB37_01729 [Leptomonas pyrrhocoris]KPA85422.1 hypothetical protein ABB37_01729 [Leptomonas pyrrhocoris]|eukprot:XP_015663860.1 hypothetical protein ABB37_01729 [Leptomonas pyrrhocoris]
MNSNMIHVRVVRATTSFLALRPGAFRRWWWPQVEPYTSRPTLGSAYRTLHSRTASSSPSAAPPRFNDPISIDASQHSAAAAAGEPPGASASTSFTAVSNAPPPPRRLLFLPAADSFAQSRVKNYLQRILATPAPEGTMAASSTGKSSKTGATTNSFSFADVVPRKLSAEEKELYTTIAEPSHAWTSSFELPVDVFVSDRLTRRYITATGVAVEPKTSIIAACMHAERCLDALRIPLFTSQQRQHQRVLQAQAEGRTSAEVSDVPHELSRVVLPPPVCLPSGASAQTTQRLASYQPRRERNAHPTARGSSSAGSGFDTSAESKGADNGTSGGHSRPPHQRRNTKKPRRRFDSYVTRYGGDPFVRTALNELAALQSTLFAHNRPNDGDDDVVDDEQELDSIRITAEEVAILQPELLPRERTPGAVPGHDERTKPMQTTVTTQAHPVTRETELYQYSHKSRIAKIDETEDGLYDLVDGFDGEWAMEPDVPGPWCLRDAGAVARVDKYVQRVSGHSFKDSVQVHFTEEDTFQFLQDKSRYGVEQKRWYTASLDLSEIGVRAVGKGTTQAVAFDLCAMHAERLLQWFGRPLYTNPHAQALYYDACLKWGRHMAAAPIDPSTVNVLSAKLPKAMKEWFRSRKMRVRGSEMNVMEKLLLLNRTVVHAYRKHLLEADIFATDKYTELFSLVEPCVRSFMVAMQHPFESAYFSLVYQKDSQYRTTIYLPLPDRYGARGGYAIASTPQNGIKLAALSAVDVLCALDVIPPVCMAQPRWQRLMELRESFGLLLPPSYVHQRLMENAATDAARAAVGPPPPPPHPLLRSPPGYRETLGLTTVIARHEDVWRIMLLDADIFDVVPGTAELKKSSRNHGGFDYAVLPLDFFREAVSYLFHWNVRVGEEHRHMFNYTGAQRYLHFRKTSANNFWMELPLDEAIYGKRIAMGRCLTRRGAERMMCIHALRILRTLKLAPWDLLGTAKLACVMYDANLQKADKRVRQWKWLCAAVLDGRADEEGEQLNLSIPEAEITMDVVTNNGGQLSSDATVNETTMLIDMKHVLSPHPVMSRELAVGTFG